MQYFAGSTLMEEPVNNGQVAKAYGLALQNIVMSNRLGVPVNIGLVAELLSGRLNKEKFPGAVCCMRLPTATSVIFENGIFQLVGTHHHMDAMLSTYLIVREIYTKLKIFPLLHHFFICDVVCSLSLGHYLDIARFCRDHRDVTVYNVETFEGCHFFIQSNPMVKQHTTTFVMFRTGRIVISGGVSVSEQLQYVRTMLPVLRRYKSDTLPKTPSYGRKRSNIRVGVGVLRRLVVNRDGVAVFRCVAPHPGGCLHQTNNWNEFTCGECGMHSTPYVYPNRISECEHTTEWTIVDQLHPHCDACGFNDVIGDAHNRYNVRASKRIRNREKALATVSRRPTDLRSSSFTKRKRFKPVVAVDHTPTVGGNGVIDIAIKPMPDPRASAELRLVEGCETVVEPSTRQPLRVYMASVPKKYQ